MLAGTYWSDSEDEDKPGGKKIASLSDDDNNDQAGDGEINKLHHARLKFKVQLDQFDEVQNEKTAKGDDDEKFIQKKLKELTEKSLIPESTR